MNICFFYPPLNHPIGSPVRWLPIRTAVLESYLRSRFSAITFSHHDPERRIRAAARRDGAFGGQIEALAAYLERSSLREALQVDRALEQPVLDRILELVQPPQSALYCFSFHDRNTLGIKIQLLLARHLKRRFPGARVAVGGLYGYGPSITDAYQVDGVELAGLPFVDFHVPFYGEAPMEAIVRSLSGGDPVAPAELDVPFDRDAFLVSRPSFDSHRDRDTHVYSPRALYRLYTGSDHPPAPFDADGEPILFVPYRFQNGCFHGRCAYCAMSSRPRAHFAVKPIETIIADLRHLRRSCGSRYFVLFNTNFNFSLSFAKRLLREMIRARLDLVWTDSFNLRVMDEELIDLLARAGCFRLDLGVVSFSMELLRRLDNVYHSETDLDWLQRISARGLWTHINVIAGLPGEGEVSDLAALIRRLRPHIDSTMINSFRLYRSRLSLEPERFGLRLAAGAGPQLLEPGRDPRARRRLSRRNYRALQHLLDPYPIKSNREQIDLYLMGYLYHALGSRRKAEIRRTVRWLVWSHRWRRALNERLPARWRAAGGAQLD